MHIHSPVCWSTYEVRKRHWVTKPVGRTARRRHSLFSRPTVVCGQRNQAEDQRLPLCFLPKLGRPLRRFFVAKFFAGKGSLKMRTLFLFASLLIALGGLSGCSAPKIADVRYLNVSGTSGYFTHAQDKATTYFVCGQAVQKNPMFGDIDVTENFWCSFSVNGRAYGKPNTGVIAKLVLEPASRFTVTVFI